jgi:hypothetical protein
MPVNLVCYPQRLKLRILGCLATLRSPALAQELSRNHLRAHHRSRRRAGGERQVVVRSIERDVAYESSTNEAGRYVTRFLPAGPYTLTVERDGFKKVTRSAHPTGPRTG